MERGGDAGGEQADTQQRQHVVGRERGDDGDAQGARGAARRRHEPGVERGEVPSRLSYEGDVLAAGQLGEEGGVRCRFGSGEAPHPLEQVVHSQRFLPGR